MTSTDLAIRDRQEIVRLDTQQIQYLANTEFVAAGMRGNLPAIFACIATGREIGIGDMAALRHIHVIDGKPGFSAEIMVVKVRRDGHSITTVGEITDKSVTVKGTRGDNDDTMTYTFTAEMAERAGLLNKQNWKRYPESMLWARAVSQVCRMLFADCFAGATYTPDELGEDSVGEPTAGIDQPLTAGAAQESTVAQVPAVTGEPASPAEQDDLPEALRGDPPPVQDFPNEKTLKKLNVIVGKLRAADHDPTGWIYANYPRAAIGVPASVNEDRQHWAPLRDRLTKSETSDLIDRLESILERVTAAREPAA